MRRDAAQQDAVAAFLASFVLREMRLPVVRDYDVIVKLLAGPLKRRADPFSETSSTLSFMKTTLHVGTTSVVPINSGFTRESILDLLILPSYVLHLVSGDWSEAALCKGPGNITCYQFSEHNFS